MKKSESFLNLLLYTDSSNGTFLNIRLKYPKLFEVFAAGT